METLEQYAKAHAATPDAYEATADALVKRILETIERHPEVANLESAWDLLKVADFKCDDLQPSAFKAGWAFSKAKHIWKQRNP